MADANMLYALQNFRGNTQTPLDFMQFWQAARAKTANALVCTTDATAGGAVFSAVSYQGAFQNTVTARYLAPETEKPTAVVLDFHDGNRAARGAFYLARYLAIGCSVLAPNAFPPAAQGGFSVCGAEKTPQEFLFYKVIQEALLAADAAMKLAGDVPLYVSGEGLGGAMALAVAALVPQVRKCAVLNPLLADYRTVCEIGADVGFYAPLRNYFRDADPLHDTETSLFAKLDYLDTVNFAAQIKGELLFGMGLLDETAPVKTQYAAFNRAVCAKTHAVFQKYGHERINFYENDALNFFLKT
ncbi:MAG: acetylxylan esterase [Ruthenibacterium sp.]